MDIDKLRDIIKHFKTRDANEVAAYNNRVYSRGYTLEDHCQFMSARLLDVCEVMTAIVDYLDKKEAE